MNQVEESSIKKFYDGADIFVTGGSGFVGRVLIEKLLRSCEGISKIFILMREKRGVEVGKRIEKLTDCMLFDKLRELNSSALDKLHVIEGDMMQLRLGISPQNMQKLKNCSQIFHCAASVRFDDPLKDAILMNTRGTQEICKLALEMPNLKSLVHVSTTYIQAKTYAADEIFYPADFEWKKFVEMAEKFDHDTMNCLEKKLMKFAPNTYTFTKHLAEQVCKDFKDENKLPIVIVRPSVIFCTEYEPLIGWMDNLNGPFTLLVTGALGLYRISTVGPYRRLDTVNADIVVKGMIIAGWKEWKDNHQSLEIYNAAKIKIFAYRTFTFVRVIDEYPSEKAIMHCNIVFTKNPILAWLVRIINAIIPAMVIDGALMAKGLKPKVLRAQRKIYLAEKALAHFTDQDFRFSNFKFLDLEKEIPSNEYLDFFLREKFYQHSLEVTDNCYKVILQSFFNQNFKNIEKVRSQYRKVVFISKSYDLIAYSFVIYFVCKILMVFVRKCLSFE